MLVAHYRTKKELRESKGAPLRHSETSVFAREYTQNGIVYVVGPTAYNRKWYARVTMKDGIVSRVE